MQDGTFTRDVKVILRLGPGRRVGVTFALSAPSPRLIRLYIFSGISE